MSESERTQTILIVDDTPDNIRILMETLREEYKILAATSGEMALKAALAENPPDLILLDIMMPGMDGFEVCGRLKQNPDSRDIPVIFITAINSPEDETRGLKTGAVDFITKPFSPLVVKARVRTHLSLKLAYLEADNARKTAENAIRSMTEGIRYARLIQRSLLPSPDTFKTCMPESFVVWRPRDIVGGDIWFVDITPDDFLLGVVDCTGHGVPGAFVSIIAASGLRSIVREEKCRDPATILRKLNSYVKTSLHQDTKRARSDDGMDVSLCRFLKNDREIVFAGARQSLFHVRNGETTVIKGDRQSIGYKRSDMNFEFASHTVQAEPGMSFYLATDGFIDQLGGKKGLAFGHKRFRQLLAQIDGRPFDTRGDLLMRAFDDYRGTNDRQDDITIVGFGF